MPAWQQLLEAKLQGIRGGKYVPDIGAGFVYQGDKFAVIGWCRVHKHKNTEQPGIDAPWDDHMAWVLEPEDDGKEHYEYCQRKEATHVMGKGIAGCIAPVSEITIDKETVGWPQDHVDAMRSRMNLLGHQHKYIR